MSALGETIKPEGETGTVDVVRHMPDQRPDNPTTIKATTSVETLNQVLHQNWIWRNTFTIDTTMKPGHIIGTIKIHPKNFHEYLAHVAEMFLTWTGSGKIRTRFMATFQFGGSFRLGFLPPKFTEQQVNNMPITTLTAYPNIDLDPKNTMWTEFQASDERNVLFHWMDDVTSEKPESFGGWFVFYVAAPLVVTGEMSQISMLVECAGGFEFAQLAPLSSVSPVRSGWLDAAACVDILDAQGCDDRYTDGYNAIQVHANAVKSLPVGFALASSIDAGKAPPLVELGSMGPSLSWLRQAVMINKSHKMTPSCETEIIINETDVNTNQPFYPHNAHHIFPHNTEPDALNWAGAQMGEEQNTVIVTAFTASAKEWVTTKPTRLFRATRPNRDSFMALNRTVTAFGCLGGHAADTPINVSKTTISGDTSKLENSLPNESIVTFVNTNIRSINVQTLAMQQSLSQISTYSPNVSQLYEMRATNTSGPILLLRLHPSGMFTTNGVTSDAVITRPEGQLYLRYLQDLPMTSPMPTNQAVLNNLKLAQRATRKNMSAAERQIEFWQRMQ